MTGFNGSDMMFSVKRSRPMLQTGANNLSQLTCVGISREFSRQSRTEEVLGPGEGCHIRLSILRAVRYGRWSQRSAAKWEEQETRPFTVWGMQKHARNMQEVRSQAL